MGSIQLWNSILWDLVLGFCFLKKYFTQIKLVSLAKIWNRKNANFSLDRVNLHRVKRLCVFCYCWKIRNVFRMKVLWSNHQANICYHRDANAHNTYICGNKNALGILIIMYNSADIPWNYAQYKTEVHRKATAAATTHLQNQHK